MRDLDAELRDLRLIDLELLESDPGPWPVPVILISIGLDEVLTNYLAY